MANAALAASGSPTEVAQRKQRPCRTAPWPCCLGTRSARLPRAPMRAPMQLSLVHSAACTSLPLLVRSLRALPG
eukprot:8886467-Alexandrium_andersonii.AAC.1